jgi:ribosomal protein L22
LNPTTTQRRNIITPGVWFQTKEITKQEDRMGDSKEGFTEMNKHRQVKHTIRGKMIKTNPKILEETMKKSRGRQAETGPNKRDKQNNLTRTRSRNPMLAGNFPISKVLLLDQTILDQIAKLILHGSRNGPKFLRSPHDDEFLILDKQE